MYVYIGGILLGVLVVRNWKLIKLVSSVITGTVSEKMNTTSTLDICSSSKAARIVVRRNGKNYVLFVPYSRSLIPRTTNKIITAVMPDDSRIVIEHPHGIKFLVTAEDIGAKHIEIRDTSSNKITCYDKMDIVTL